MNNRMRVFRDMSIGDSEAAGLEAGGRSLRKRSQRFANVKSSRGNTSRCVLQTALTLLLGLSSLVTTTTAQEVGVDICACQPSGYNMVLQLDLTCEDRTVDADDNPGVNDTSCLISSRNPSEEVNDFVPTTVQEIQVFELDQRQDVLRSRVYESDFLDGDEVDFSSFVVTNPEDITATSLPKVLAVTVTARNAGNQPLLNTWAIRFDNDCGVFPVLTTGQRIGWIRFADLADPPVDGNVCPRVSSPPSVAPTDAPTVVASSSPTVAVSMTPSAPPSVTLSNAPTVGPTGEPSVAPTHAPTGGPTVVPSVSPTGSPSVSPSLGPTDTPGSPTKAPVLTEPPSVPPSSGPTDSPTVLPSSIPTTIVTKAPTTAPTNGPTTLLTDAPTTVPTNGPTFASTTTPSVVPTMLRTKPPVPEDPTDKPTVTPTPEPTISRRTTPPSRRTASPTTPYPDMPTSTPSCAPVVPGDSEKGGKLDGGRRYRKKKSKSTGSKSSKMKMSRMKKSSSSSSKGDRSSSSSSSSMGKKPSMPDRKKEKKVRKSRGRRDHDKLRKSSQRRQRRLMVGPRPPPTSSPIDCPE